jgi:hypothetical protein
VIEQLAAQPQDRDQEFGTDRCLVRLVGYRDLFFEALPDYVQLRSQSSRRQLGRRQREVVGGGGHCCLSTLKHRRPVRGGCHLA